MQNTLNAVKETNFNLPDRRQGKVRDIYRVPMEGRADPLLIIASDRMSAFDVVMPTPFPGKGRLLTEISLAWFDSAPRASSAITCCRPTPPMCRVSTMPSARRSKDA